MLYFAACLSRVGTRPRWDIVPLGHRPVETRPRWDAVPSARLAVCRTTRLTLNRLGWSMQVCR